MGGFVRDTMSAAGFVRESQSVLPHRPECSSQGPIKLHKQNVKVATFTVPMPTDISYDKDNACKRNELERRGTRRGKHRLDKEGGPSAHHTEKRLVEHQVWGGRTKESIPRFNVSRRMNRMKLVSLQAQFQHSLSALDELSLAPKVSKSACSMPLEPFPSPQQTTYTMQTNSLLTNSEIEMTTCSVHSPRVVCTKEAPIPKVHGDS